MGQEEDPLSRMDWDIRREGRAWSPDEWDARRELTPEKIEMSRGMLFYSDDYRLAMLALLLENLGADRAVRLGDPQIWREAVALLERDKG